MILVFIGRERDSPTGFTSTLQIQGLCKYDWHRQPGIVLGGGTLRII